MTQFGGNPTTYGLPAATGGTAGGVTGSPVGTAPGPGTAPGTTSANGAPNFTPEQKSTITSSFNADLEARLALYPGLSESEKEAIRIAGGAIASNDEDLQKRFLAAVEIAIPNADAIFKEKLRLAQAELTNAFSAQAGDLAYNVKQRENVLKDLRETIARQGEFLTLEEQSQLREIEVAYRNNLEEARTSAAEAGFTFSTRAKEKEGLLATQTGEMRESTARKFGYQQAENAQKLSIAERDTQNEIVRLQEVAKQNEQEMLRKGEGAIGTGNLPALDTGATPLGDITGDLERKKSSDILAGSAFAF